MGEQQTWVVAVSGGIDSVVLLDILHEHSSARLVVAHVDHGIRDNGEDDLLVVQKHAAMRNLHLECTTLALGRDCSEARARTVRYEWLNSIVKKHAATKLVTAHHQDDVLETIVINHLRGTGWRGLTSLRSHDTVYRPLLHMSKARIIAYALHHNLEWREDDTNEDMRYLRNAVRAAIIPRLSSEHRHRLLRLYESQVDVVAAIDTEVVNLESSFASEQGMSRYWLTMAPPEVATVCLEYYSQSRLQRSHAKQLLHFARAGRPGAILELPGHLSARLTTDELIVSRT